MKVVVGLIIGVLVVAGILASSLQNKGDLKRLQELKNKRRFSGRRLSVEEAEELNRLQVRYWWY